MSATDTCRICGGGPVSEAGSVEYVLGFGWTVRDCAGCGCRFTRHDETVHALLHHSGAMSHYYGYRELTRQARAHFEAGDGAAMARLLSGSAKFRFVIDGLAGLAPDARVLEYGCSRGYLTAHFILQGRRVLGVDVSADALAEARAAFGDHFAVAGGTRESDGVPYDAIYHVGLIGCVSDPMGLTRRLLSMLKPGGRLIFNAPNRDAMHWRGQLWFDSAPPPDVVTLFPAGFWTRHFGGLARVVERVECLPPAGSAGVRLRRAIGPRWKRPAARQLRGGPGDGHRWEQPARPGWSFTERAVSKAAVVTGLANLVTPVPSEYGLYVEMVAG